MAQSSSHSTGHSLLRLPEGEALPSGHGPLRLVPAERGAGGSGPLSAPQRYHRNQAALQHVHVSGQPGPEAHLPGRAGGEPHGIRTAGPHREDPVPLRARLRHDAHALLTSHA